MQNTEILYQVELWLPVAICAFVSFSLIFLSAPTLVKRLLRPYAKLTYRNDKDRLSSGGRYVTFCHAVAISYLNFYLVFGDKLYAKTQLRKGSMELLWPGSTGSNVSLAISLGYFLLDAFVVAWFLPAIGGIEMVIHHVCAFLSVLTTIYHQSCHFYTLLLLATEITTPFINFRWLLEKMQWKQTWWYKANGLLLLFSWFLARIVLYVYIFGTLFHRRDQIPHIPILVRIPLLVTPPTLAVLNLIWFNKILKGALKVFGKQTPQVQRKQIDEPKMNGKSH